MRSLGTLVMASCLALVASSATASEYGCQVLLCLANPGGPTEFTECRPPIERLWRDLERGRDFPECDEGKPAVAQRGYSDVDPCPEGMTSLPAGQQATLARRTSPDSSIEPTVTEATPTSIVPVIEPYRFRGREADAGRIYAGTEESGPEAAYRGGDAAPTARVCVGQRVAWSSQGQGGDSGESPIGVYDAITLMDRHPSPRYIDVFIGDTLYRRVRY